MISMPACIDRRLLIMDDPPRDTDNLRRNQWLERHRRGYGCERPVGYLAGFSCRVPGDEARRHPNRLPGFGRARRIGAITGVSTSDLSAVGRPSVDAR